MENSQRDAFASFFLMHDVRSNAFPI